MEPSDSVQSIKCYEKKVLTLDAVIAREIEYAIENNEYAEETDCG